jgi:hypothetical protein
MMRESIACLRLRVASQRYGVTQDLDRPVDELQTEARFLRAAAKRARRDIKKLRAMRASTKKRLTSNPTFGAHVGLLKLDRSIQDRQFVLLSDLARLTEVEGQIKEIVR